MYLTLGAKYEQEHNAIRDALSHNLSTSSYAFDILTFYARTREDRKTRVELNYTIRKDETVVGDHFEQQNNAHTIDAKMRYLPVQRPPGRFHRRLPQADGQ